MGWVWLGTGKAHGMGVARDRQSTWDGVARDRHELLACRICK